MSVLAFLFAFIFFMQMMDQQSKVDKLRNQGVVSRALVVEKKVDTLVREGRRGRSTSTDIQVLRVRHVKKSPVKYADFPSKVAEADLPVAPPAAEGVLDEMDYGGIMWVSTEVYDRTNVGDMLTVVNTPFDPESPELVSDVQSFDGGPAYYPSMGISLALTVVFAFIGWLIGRAPR